MGTAIVFCALSLVAGCGVAFFNAGLGVVVAVSLMGAGIIYSINKK